MKAFVIIITLFCSFGQSLYADSPLTSTHISVAYSDHPRVIEAKNAKGTITKSLMKFLHHSSTAIEIKIAVINELGWNFNGHDNARIFLEYLVKRDQRFSNKDQFKKKAEGELLICMAYLKALDNYFHVEDALDIAKEATKKSPNSYTIQLIYSLIEAQTLIEKDACKAYKSTNKVRSDNELTKDMKDSAIKIVFDYMDLFKDSCNK